MNKYKYDLHDRAMFYLYYLTAKTKVPLDLKNNRKNIMSAEFIWVCSKVLRFKPFIVERYKSNFVETKFGKFHINPDLISTIAVSPSFERREIEILLNLMEKDIELNKSILFVDVGAFFGLYTVIVGNRFKEYKKIDLVSFEPDTFYLSDATFELLKKNIKVNNLKKSKIYHFGLGSVNSKKKNKVGVVTKKLDTVITNKELKKYDKIYMKIDVDGYEKDVLEGAKSFIKNSKELTLLIEDFVNPRIVKYLEKDFEFISKPSSYNSFWRKK